MTTLKRIDRKAFLASTVAAVSAVALGSCSGESVEDGTAGTGGTNTGGTATGGTATGGTATGGTATGGTATGGTATGGGAGLASGATGGGGSGNGGLGGAPTGGSSGAGGAGGMSANGGTGGDGGSGGGTYVCTTMTSNGDHSHPLTVLSSDVVRGYQDAPYVLEEGGTGHTHTVEVTIYDFGYLKGGTVVTVMSSATANHTHPCVMSCVI